MAAIQNIAFHEILSAIDTFDNFLKSKIKFNKETFDILKTKSPGYLRQIMDGVWPKMELAVSDLSQYNEQVDYSIRRLNETKNLINQLNDVVNDIQINFNKAKIGTLEGLARDTINKSKIVPSEEDIIQTAVLEQSYDETSATNRGGKQKRRKTRKTRKTRKMRKRG
jgi:cysteinyl-tRNA synthetase